MVVIDFPDHPSKHMKASLILFLLAGLAHGQFVQGNTTDTGSAARQIVTCAFPSPVAAGDTLMVCVSWFAPTATPTATDTLGDQYTPVSAPVVDAVASQQVLYCGNAKAGWNTVTVQMSTPVTWIHVMVLEYTGALTLDTQSSATGNSSTLSSGATMTAKGQEFLIGFSRWDYASVGSFSAPGPGFTVRVGKTARGIAEDAVSAAAGSYSATMSIEGGRPWIMQLVAFYTGAAPTPTPVAAPTAPVAGQVTMAWNAPSPPVSYLLSIGTESGGPYTMSFNTSSTATQYKVTGLKSGQTYYAVVESVDANGNVSCPSPQISFVSP
jgi:hypothetical protein